MHRGFDGLKLSDPKFGGSECNGLLEKTAIEKKLFEKFQINSDRRQRNLIAVFREAFSSERRRLVEVGSEERPQTS